METLKNPGPQWDKAARQLAALCVAGDKAALKIASKDQSVETACRYFDGNNSPEGKLVESLKALVWWDETTIDDGKPALQPVDWAKVEEPGGWKSDD